MSIQASGTFQATGASLTVTGSKITGILKFGSGMVKLRIYMPTSLNTMIISSHVTDVMFMLDSYCPMTWDFDCTTYVSDIEYDLIITP